MRMNQFTFRVLAGEMALVAKWLLGVNRLYRKQYSGLSIIRRGYGVVILAVFEEGGSGILLSFIGP
jgi:hypothetical protein